MRKVLVIGLLLLLLSTASVSYAATKGEAPEKSTMPTLRVVSGAKALSKEEKAAVSAKHICWRVGSGYWFICIPSGWVHRHPPGL